MARRSPISAAAPGFRAFRSRSRRLSAKYLLVDSNGKKARFLREAVRRLGLTHTRVAESRVENVEGTFECITARAFASLGEMLARGGHLLAPEGRWLALKGRYPEDELAALPGGFRVEEIVALRVPGLDAERHLVVLRRAVDAKN